MTSRSASVLTALRGAADAARASFLRVGRVPQSKWGRLAGLAAPVIALMTLFIVTGLRGVNFGYHWDEVDWQIKPVRDMVESGLFFPRATIYPALTKWLVLLPAIPPAIQEALSPQGTVRGVQAAMLAAVDAPQFLLKVRGLFVVVSALGILWVYCAALTLGRKSWEAFVAAASLGLSWEYAYHSRWVAADCVLVHFAALVLFMLGLFQRSSKLRWLCAAAVAAGLGTGTKYPGVVLIVPVVLSSVLALPIRAVRAQGLRLFIIGALSGLTYFVTTPATLLEPFAFIEQSQWISTHYAGGHYGYSAKDGWDHARMVLTYLALEYFSPYRLLAILMFAATVVGALSWLRSDRRMGSVLVTFPVVFVLFFCSRYLACIVRNYLLVVPFLALLTGRGISTLSRLISYQSLRWLAAAGLAGALGAQAVWLVLAGESIHRVVVGEHVQAALEHIAKSDASFELSRRVREAAAKNQLSLPGNVTREGADQVVFFVLAEGPGPYKWRSNDPWLTEAVYGPRDVNFNWYPTWLGQERVVVMRSDKAKEMGVRLAR